MRFVDIDEIYRRIDEESDRVCFLLHRNHPESVVALLFGTGDRLPDVLDREVGLT